MTFDEYRLFVKSMKRYPEQFTIMYPALGLAGEAGEIAEKIKKWLRDYKPSSPDDMPEEIRQALLLELGDPLWYITSLADDLGFTLDDVVEANVAKLSSRKDRGVIHGSGDSR